MAVCIRKIISRTEQEWYMPMLMKANPNKDAVVKDLARGDLFVLEDGGTAVSCAIVGPLNLLSCELLNLSTRDGYERRGYSKVLLHYLFAIYRDLYKSMVVGTAEFSTIALDLYESQGFRRIRVIENYFVDNYPQAVYEEGRLCKDMVVLERALS